MSRDDITCWHELYRIASSYIHHIATSHRISQRVGYRAHKGRAVLAHLEEHHVREVIVRELLPQFSPHVVTDVRPVLEEGEGVVLG